MRRNVLTTVLTIATITTMSSSSYSLDGGTLASPRATGGGLLRSLVSASIPQRVALIGRCQVHSMG